MVDLPRPVTMMISRAASGYGLFDAILDEGLVDEAEHLFGRGFGGGKEASAEASGREHGFADLLRSELVSWIPWMQVRCWKS